MTSSGVLLDANVLIALTVQDHVHHMHAEEWLASMPERFATCPITQGSLVRMLVRSGARGGDAAAAIEALMRHPRHELWADDLPYDRVRLDGVVGHRQVTDAYLAALARTRGSRLATFDAGLASEHPDVVTLVPKGARS